jgi:hypothetical protein
MKKSAAIKCLLIVILLGILFIAEKYNYLNFRPSEDLVTPTVIRQTFEEMPNITEVRDLLEIAYALERYKVDNWSYPISSVGNKGWDGIKSDFGESREDWIRGLVPTYIDRLPRDPRMLDNGIQQYLYMSNGANYKLIAFKPSNCHLVELSYPSLIDPKRGCQAFGFWSEGAVHW